MLWFSVLHLLFLSFKQQELLIVITFLLLIYTVYIL